MKFCPKCGNNKPLSEFYKNRARKDGVDTYCKDCEKARNKEPKRAEQNRKANRVYITKNPELQKARQADWYSRNKSEHAAYGREYRERTIEQSRAREANIAQRRRARRRENGVLSVSSKDILALLSQPCLACGTCESITIEHLVPLARGGRHSIGNLAPLCQSCNSSKGSMLWVEWKHSNRPRALEVFTAA